jgi:hypothetical protein
MTISRKKKRRWRKRREKHAKLYNYFLNFGKLKVYVGKSFLISVGEPKLPPSYFTNNAYSRTS